VAAPHHGAVTVRPAIGAARLILAIESATLRPSVALLEGEEILALRVALPGASAAAVVLPAVEAVLAEAGAALDDIGLFALAIGPGSFTGLRVGLATLKGLAFESERLVVPVPTLAALCLAAGSAETPVAAMLDARRGEVYAAAYGPAAPAPGEVELLPEGLYRLLDVAARLSRDCCITGDGAPLLSAALAAAGLPAATEVVHPPAAPAVARLALRLFVLGRARTAAELVPRYLRRAEAEARRTGEPLEREKPF